jgi:hypothetical protein
MQLENCLFKTHDVVNEVYQKRSAHGRLKKQSLVWKPHNCNLSTWASFKVNTNQPIDVNANQVMRCIICHNHICGLELIPLCILGVAKVWLHNTKEMTLSPWKNKYSLNIKHCLQRMWSMQLITLYLHLIKNQLVKGPTLYQMSSLVFFVTTNKKAWGFNYIVYQVCMSQHSKVNYMAYKI